ncbi:MAG: hypothetical protein ACYS47_05865 [Planctomycetota bacterium]|jgi:hypothetical protein
MSARRRKRTSRTRRKGRTRSLRRKAQGTYEDPLTAVIVYYGPALTDATR